MQGSTRANALVAAVAVMGLAGSAAPTAIGEQAPAKAAAPANPTVTRVIELTKSGLSDDLVVRAVTRENLGADLGADDMLTLKRAGVSDKVITAMLDAAPTTAAPSAVAPAVALAVAAAPMPAPAAAAMPDPRAGLRRAAIDEFQWATVSTAVQSVFGTSVDIGKGIRALLTKRIQDAGRMRIVERARVNTLMKEQDFGASNRVRQGTNARIGQILGADVYVMGDIVAFGRDDRDKRLSLGALGFGGVLGGVRVGKKEDMAVVVINYQLVDAETSEVIDTGEARGESKRKSSGLGGIFGWSGGVVGGSVDMTSQNFSETIIGEAVIEATDQIAAIMNEKVPTLPVRQIDIEARVAATAGGSVTIAAGSNQGVEVGHVFDVFRIVSEIHDPVTGEVLDNQVEPLGVMTVTAVRDRVATGTYSGKPVTNKDGLVRRRIP